MADEKRLEEVLCPTFPIAAAGGGLEILWTVTFHESRTTPHIW